MAKDRVLLVDDDTNVLASIQRHLNRDFEIVTFERGRQALGALRQEEPFAVLVSDYRMPDMNGLTFLKEAREIAPNTVRILLTGYADVDMSVQAINEDNVFRLLLKPCPKEMLVKALEDGINQYHLMVSEHELLDETLNGSVKVFIDILSMLNPIIFNRSANLRQMAIKVANQLSFDHVWEVELSVLLSQIGSVSMPKEILDKLENGESLLPTERSMYQTQARVGCDLLDNIPRLHLVAEGIFYQYKLYNGEGYPANGVKRDAIPWIGRLLKVLFDFDELNRQYNNPMLAVAEMQKQTTWYDPQILTALHIELIGMKVNKPKKMVERFIKAEDIRTGMIMARDVFDLKHHTLITKGTEVSKVMEARLLNYARYKNIIEPIFILVPEGE
ncbi:MAG: response regulator [Anaerolineaceae bacterium]|nr:response regulator [Anaerolineaceae bacterium]